MCSIICWTILKYQIPGILTSTSNFPQNAKILDFAKNIEDLSQAKPVCWLTSFSQI